MISLARAGVRCAGSAHELARFRAAFDERHHVVLRGFLEPELLKTLSARVERGPFIDREHIDPGRGRRVCVERQLANDETLGVFLFLMNEPGLFRLIEAITGCPPIGSYLGRVYRKEPGPGHFDDWHTDLQDGRLVTASLNLSREAYRGGLLQMRRRGTETPFLEVANTGFGDALLFQIGPDLQHRVSGVEGVHPKTALAGWFRAAEHGS